MLLGKNGFRTSSVGSCISVTPSHRGQESQSRYSSTRTAARSNRAGPTAFLKQGMAESNGTSNGTDHSVPHLALVPQRFTKVVHFVRHGEGFHNIGWEDNLDAHLTDYGWQQAAALGEHIRRQRPPLDIQLVVVSPLMRTCETAAGVFGDSGGSADSGELLMLAKTGQPHVRSKHGPITRPGNLPFLAEELCRERMGENRCDSRRLLQQVKDEFPGIDFASVPTEEDVLWAKVSGQRNSSGMYPDGESEEATTQRGLQFLKWLMGRPESRIAVVAHAGIIQHTLSAFASTLPHEATEDLTREFNNCEMRTMVLSDASVPAQPDPLHFPGGRAWQGAAAACQPSL